ncbi:MAG: peptidoglycan-binding domain-containing protein, partial [Christensenellales bacterium]
GNKEGYILAELLRQVRPVKLLPVTEGEVREMFPVISSDPIADIKNEIPFTYTDDELAAYKTLNVGDRGNDVLKLRKRLYELGYYTKRNENALYTQSTADVIKVFQKDCGLEETGVADPYTQGFSFTAACSPAKAASRRSPTCKTKLSRSTSSARKLRPTASTEACRSACGTRQTAS